MKQALLLMRISHRVSLLDYLAQTTSSQQICTFTNTSKTLCIDKPSLSEQISSSSHKPSYTRVYLYINLC